MLFIGYELLMKNLPGWLFNFTLYGSWSEAFYSPTVPGQSHPHAGKKTACCHSGMTHSL